MHNTSEPSLLRAEMIVDWKRKRGVYNFESLPAKAIIGLTAAIFKALLPTFPKKLKGIPGSHFIQGDHVFCSGFGSGAPALVTLMEELRSLGVREFIFMGLCASLVNDIKSGQAFYVAQALSANGITSSYAEGDIMQPYNEDFVNTLAKKLVLEAATCISTDSPFRETAGFINEAKTKGCSLIEMECAAAYAFAQFHKLNVACILVVADQMDPHWQAPEDMNLLMSVQKQLVSTIVKSNL